MKGGATTTWSAAEALQAVQALSMMPRYKKKTNKLKYVKPTQNNFNVCGPQMATRLN